MPILAQTNNQMFNLQKSIGWIAANLFGSIFKTVLTATPIAAIAGAYFTKAMPYIPYILGGIGVFSAAIFVCRLMIYQATEKMGRHIRTLELSQYVHTVVTSINQRWQRTRHIPRGSHANDLLDDETIIRHECWQFLQMPENRLGFTLDELKYQLDKWTPPSLQVPNEHP